MYSSAKKPLFSESNIFKAFLKESSGSDPDNFSPNKFMNMVKLRGPGDMPCQPALPPPISKFLVLQLDKHTILR
jgi:hypothetical protein